MLCQLLVRVNRIVSEVNGLALDNERYRLVVYFTKLSSSLLTGMIDRDGSCQQPVNINAGDIPIAVYTE
jgi:hypothetical protein